MNESVFKKRVYITALVLAVCTFFFVIRLFDLHFSERVILPSVEPLDTGRGFIKDRSGYYLAMSIEYDSIFANPSEIKNHDVAAEQIASAAGLSRDFVRDKLATDKKFVWIKRKCDRAVADSVRNLKMKGVYLRKEYKRVYPYDELASGLIGFVGIDNNGLEGIEFEFDKILSGRDEIARDETGRDIYLRKNIYLTIDRYIQYVAEEELENAVRQHGGKQCAVIIMDVSSGRILALAKKPSFNPNLFQNYDPLVRKNYIIVESFEPGSTLKVMSLISLMENKPDALKREYFCDGDVEINDVRINCLHKHGRVLIPDIIRESCNAGMIQSVRTLEKSEFYKTLKKFGFGERTGIELPGEGVGILRPVNQWSGLSKYSMSIGHEIAVTGIQLTAAFNAIANDGVYVKPSIIERIEKPDGVSVKNFYPAARGRIITSAQCNTVLGMMRDVVKNGTGKRGDSAFYEIAGKTGTSQKFSEYMKAYSDRNVSSFIGIAPYNRPVITMLVVVDDPGDSGTGGVVAAPVFSRITERVLPYLGVGGKDISSLAVKGTAKDKDVNYGTVPDLTGMGAGEASEVLRVLGERNGVRYFIKGEGRVYAQKPAAGSEIKNNSTLIIFMR